MSEKVIGAAAQICTLGKTSEAHQCTSLQTGRLHRRGMCARKTEGVEGTLESWRQKSNATMCSAEEW